MASREASFRCDYFHSIMEPLNVSNMTGSRYCEDLVNPGGSMVAEMFQGNRRRALHSDDKPSRWMRQRVVRGSTPRLSCGRQTRRCEIFGLSNSCWLIVGPGLLRAESSTANAPVPSVDAVAASIKTIQQVYKDDIARAKSLEQKITLARKLLHDAIETTNDPTGRYAGKLNRSNLDDNSRARRFSEPVPLEFRRSQCAVGVR